MTHYGAPMKKALILAGLAMMLIAGKIQAQ